MKSFSSHSLPVLIVYWCLAPSFRPEQTITACPSCRLEAFSIKAIIFKGFPFAALQKGPQWPWFGEKLDLSCFLSVGAIWVTTATITCWDAEDFDVSESSEEQLSKIPSQLAVEESKLVLWKWECYIINRKKREKRWMSFWLNWYVNVTHLHYTLIPTLKKT